VEVELEDALCSTLLADAGFRALAGDRLYPGAAGPGAALPYVVYEQPDEQLTPTLDGWANLNVASWRLDCYAATRAGAKAVRRAARGALLALAGDSPGGAFRWQGTFIDGGDAGAEPPEDGSELPLHRAGLDVRIGYSETGG
jgi:hypothetical protein